MATGECASVRLERIGDDGSVEAGSAGADDAILPRSLPGPHFSPITIPYLFPYSPFAISSYFAGARITDGLKLNATFRQGRSGSRTKPPGGRRLRNHDEGLTPCAHSRPATNRFSCRTAVSCGMSSEC